MMPEKSNGVHEWTVHIMMRFIWQIIIQLIFLVMSSQSAYLNQKGLLLRTVCDWPLRISMATVWTSAGRWAGLHKDGGSQTDPRQQRVRPKKLIEDEQMIKATTNKKAATVTL